MTEPATRTDPAATNPTPTETEAAETARPVSAKAVRIAIAAAALWLLGLAALALTTANPVVLNKQQIAAATIVAEAGPSDVSQVWVVRGVDVPPESVQFVRPFTDDARYLVPLKPLGTRYEPVAVRLDRDRDPVPLYYPATDESRAKLDALLGEIDPAALRRPGE